METALQLGGFFHAQGGFRGRTVKQAAVILDRRERREAAMGGHCVRSNARAALHHGGYTPRNYVRPAKPRRCRADHDLSAGRGGQRRTALHLRRSRRWREGDLAAPTPEPNRSLDDSERRNRVRKSSRYAS
jgi:hypothetical protein